MQRSTRPITSRWNGRRACNNSLLRSVGPTGSGFCRWGAPLVTTRIHRILRYLLFLSFAVLLLILAFRGVDLEQLGHSFGEARYGYILLFLLFGLLTLFSRAYRWSLLIETLDHRPSLLNSFSALNFGYLANLAFPRLGEIARCAALTRVERVPFDRLLGTVIVERVVDLLMVLILLLTLLALRFDFFGAWLSEELLERLAHRVDGIAGGNVLIPGVLAAAAVATIAWYFVRRAASAGATAAARVRAFLRGIVDGLKSIYHLKRRRAFILHSILIWALYWGMAYASFFALPETSVLDPVDALFVVLIGTLGFIIPTQAGIGSYHLVVTLGLTLYDIPREVGLTYATLTHGAQIILSVALGCIALLVFSTADRRAASSAPAFSGSRRD